MFLGQLTEWVSLHEVCKSGKFEKKAKQIKQEERKAIEIPRKVLINIEESYNPNMKQECFEIKMLPCIYTII